MEFRPVTEENGDRLIEALIDGEWKPLAAVPGEHSQHVVLRALTHLYTETDSCSG